MTPSANISLLSSPSSSHSQNKISAKRSVYGPPSGPIEDSDEDIQDWKPNKSSKRLATSTFAAYGNRVESISEEDNRPIKRRYLPKSQTKSLAQQVAFTNDKYVTSSRETLIQKLLNSPKSEVNLLSNNREKPVARAMSDFGDEASIHEDSDSDVEVSKSLTLTALSSSISGAKGKKQKDLTTYENDDGGKRYYIKATPWLYKLGTAFNARNMEIDSGSADLTKLDIEERTALQDLTDHMRKLRTQAGQHRVKTVKSPIEYWYDEIGHRKVFASVEIDGVLFYPGDFVMVRSSFRGNKYIPYSFFIQLIICSNVCRRIKICSGKEEETSGHRRFRRSKSMVCTNCISVRRRGKSMTI